MPKIRKAEAKAEKTVNGSYHPTHKEIELRAYQIYRERGGAPGDALGDWTLAERQLVEQHSKGNRKGSLKTQAA